MRIRRIALVSGRVQGVGFRYSTLATARPLGVCGTVRNLVDGRVEADVEGPPQQVQILLDWLEDGPATARVTGVETRSAEPRGLQRFEVH